MTLAIIMALASVNSRPVGAVHESNSKEQVSKVLSITLKGSGENVEWSVNGHSKGGFKVVWSKNEGPTYPLRSGDKYHYFTDSSKNSDKLEAFNGDGYYYVRVCEYLNGKCYTYSNQVKMNLDKNAGKVTPVYCTLEYAPVCAKNGKTYSNKCVAEKQYNQKIAHEGPCEANLVKDDAIEDIRGKADLLISNNLQEILRELKELRNIVKEQQAELKYLKTLMGEMRTISEEARNSINNFVTYGIDDNTKRLGEGERSAVIYSFKEAFGKLPESEEELTDLIKIANGRWPKNYNQEAELRARELFMEIYKRDLNEDNEKDVSAAKIMAYGLRQRAENRNLNSEKKGIEIFKNIFGELPETTENWNVMQAITYSGATR